MTITPGSSQPPSPTEFLCVCCVDLGGTGAGSGAIRCIILGEIRMTSVGENFTFCAANTSVLCARLSLRIIVGDNFTFCATKN